MAAACWRRWMRSSCVHSPGRHVFMDATVRDVTDGLPPAARRRALTTLAIAVAMAVLDGAIANIALPSIARDMQVAPATSIWVVNAYQLAVTVALLPMASLGDIYGY